MAPTAIVPGLWQLGLGSVNAFVLDDGGELTLVDTGMPGSEGKIVKAIEGLGRQPADIARIVVTHCHPDHAGSLAALKRIVDAPAIMHRADAEMVRRGEGKRPMSPAPGLGRRVLFHLFVASSTGKIAAAEVETEVEDGSEIPAAGGLRVVHVPGHCAGQIALLWPARRVLFAADAAGTMLGLGFSIVYEDLERGRRDLARLASLDFDVACFGHGRPIVRDAAKRFRERWGATLPETTAR